ncbi:hypothetical protein BDV97DRAFT_391262 [Delphinella strobiligena]|nr:hypothetical protein BDV97DRAFT_391262 [Delphinella strobiligena]
MPGQVAPWLEDLDEDWVQPPGFINATATKQSTPDAANTSNHNHNDNHNQYSRIPRRSSGVYSNALASDSIHTSQRRRAPLTELSSSVGNVTRDGAAGSKLPVSRSVSIASAGSVVRYDTIQRKKSSSPDKKATLEWKRRLIDGELGYGDQTDLFGPSALENIFQSPPKLSTPATRRLSYSSRRLKLFRQQDFPPSSPPPYPSTIDITRHSSPAPQGQGTCAEAAANLDHDEQEQAEGGVDGPHTEYDESSHAGSDVSPSALNTSPCHLPGLGQSQSGMHRRFLRPDPSNTNTANRTISGQTDYSGEDFSPVFISKHTSLDGRVNYAAVDSKTTKPPQPDTEPDKEDFLDETMPSVPEVSLPENLPTGTPPIAALGRYVNVERGGLSTYGSFNTRPLSSSHSESLSQSAAEPDDDQDEQSDGSVRRTPQPLTPSRPGTPMTKRESTLLSPPKTRPSTSPLKLFGNYDTFTNNRLLRRMSQLEDLEMPTSANSDDADDTVLASVRDQTVSPTIGSHTTWRASRPSQRHIMPSLSSFGEGELDEHDFEADLSIPSALQLSDGDSFDASPPPEVAPPGSRTPFRFHLEESPDLHHDPRHMKRKLSKRSTAKSRASAEYETLDARFPAWDTDSTHQHAEGKRPRSSPTKAPTPKRRRTIVALNGQLPNVGLGTEIQVKITGASTDGSPSTSLAETGSWKRSRDSATRPRNPTPSQSTPNDYRREQIHAEVGEATMAFLSSSPRLDAVKENLDLTDIPEASLTEEQAKSLAAEVAAFTFNGSKSQSEGKRNRSITTQDFLDEAMHIMSLIRARGRPLSGLESLEEHDMEEVDGTHLRPETVAPRSPSPLRLSRPPSREGGSQWRPHSQISHDPRIVSQLRKFQEDDDELHLVGSSLRSLNVNGLDIDIDQTALTDDLSIVRIRGPRPETSRSRGQSDVSNRSKGSPSKTHGSHPSLDSSSSRTVGTHSTRKSDNVATLAPETVAHLIPEEVAGMTFDKQTQRWVRIKGSKREQREILSPLPTPSCLTSDDDPFNGIPDLTVDEMKELKRVSMSPSKDFSFNDETLEESSIQQESCLNSNETVVTKHLASDSTTRPVTRENPVAPPFTSSSVPSKYSAFGSSQQQQLDTRATSWTNEEFTHMKRSKHQAIQTGHGLLDLAAMNMPHPISDIPEHGEEESGSDEASISLDDSLTEELPAPEKRQEARQAWLQSSPASLYRGGLRQISLRRQTLHRGLHSGGQDSGELSFVATLPDKRTMSVSVNLSRPTTTSGKTDHDLIVPSSSPEKVDATFILSDLPDFTVNEEDEEHPSEKRLAKRIAQHATDDRYGMAVQSLVKTLTDVEPDEPFWEDIKQLSLRERDLGSVHNLEDFCTRLEDLDLSNNNIAHLEGAPHSIRRLNVRSNALSSLTAWSHLINLQYLDISGNSVDSLAGLSMLVHLREVRADDNQISSLDGIMGLDGLLKLSVRRNSLAGVDLEGCELKRLEELDLTGNQLTEFTHAESLPSLSRLVLDDNRLVVFASGACDAKMASLSLQRNRLSSLDVDTLTNLRYLNVDENRLATVQGLERLRSLNVLSMRKQSVSRLAVLDQHIHARSLYLSSNAIPSLALPHSYHSVQELEISHCGLQELPNEFGVRFPNLRMINLAFNALTDVRPLLNIPRLQVLHIPGNRLCRLRKTVATLARMQQLRRFDARDNPISLGFYPPTATAAALTTAKEQSIILSSGPSSENAETETEEHVQLRAVRAYALPSADRASDAEHCERLDEDTKLRRRVYELLLSQSCRSLDILDGLSFDRAKATIRDRVWERLIQLGVMKKSTKVEGQDAAKGRTSICELEV